MSWVYRVTHVAEAAQRMKERKEKNKAAYEERKRKQKKERAQTRKKRRLSKKPTTGNSSPVVPNKWLTSRINDLPPILPRGRNALTEGYWWVFGKEAPPKAQEEWDKKQAEKRQGKARRRIEGYEWFFE